MIYMFTDFEIIGHHLQISPVLHAYIYMINDNNHNSMCTSVYNFQLGDFWPLFTNMDWINPTMDK